MSAWQPLIPSDVIPGFAYGRKALGSQRPGETRAHTEYQLAQVAKANQYETLTDLIRDLNRLNR